MPSYKAPLRDMRFVMNDVFNMDEHYTNLGATDVPEMKDAIIEEAAKFAENVIFPLNLPADKEGCVLKDGKVITPKGYKEAYKQYVEGGWPSIAQDANYGGQGLPPSLGYMLSEVSSSANLAWSMYPGLSAGAMDALGHYGSEELKQTYLTKMISGVWTGTMCLTEPHAGTDLGLIKTKAEPAGDAYEITGTKIFISAGDHDLSENIVHLVLAKLPGAPEGTKGISLFIVPKFSPDANGDAGEFNNVSCGGLEEKMGIHSNATCIINFDKAKGYLVGEPNKGLKAMFVMMNDARMGVGIQGLGLIEASYQNALEYARERLQMRSLTGVKAPESPADPIITHPDVRRMLLTQKAFAEGARGLIYYAGKLADTIRFAKTDEEKQAADTKLGLLTPIIKAFITEVGFEATNAGVQVFGGHGFIRENGMEQYVRDSRITLLYEGTTGIQALDLLGRKILLSQGASLREFTKEIHKFCKAEEGNADLAEFITPLQEKNQEWGDITMKIGMAAMQNKDEVGSASVDYLMYSGYVTFAYIFALMAKAASEKLAAGTEEKAFYETKLKTARFYFKRILPRTRALVESMVSGADVLNAFEVEEFGLGFEI